MLSVTIVPNTPVCPAALSVVYTFKDLLNAAPLLTFSCATARVETAPVCIVNESKEGYELHSGTRLLVPIPKEVVAKLSKKVKSMIELVV